MFRKQAQIYLSVFCILMGVSVIRADDVTLEQVGEYHPDGEFYKCKIAGTRLYLSDEWGLVIYDASNPAQIRKLGEVAIPGFCSHLAVIGNYAYIGTFLSNILYIVDVRNPSQPERVKEINFNTPWPGSIHSFQHEGNRIYINASTGWWTEFGPESASVYVVDITDPPNAKILYNFHSGIYHVQIVENFMYVLGFDQLITTDISDPKRPRAASVISIPNQADPNQAEVILRVMDKYLLVIGGSEGVLVWSLRDPAHPQLIGSLGLSIWASDAVVDGNTIAIYEPEQGILLIDVSDLTNPRYMGDIPVPYMYGTTLVYGMSLENKRLYFVGTDRQLQVWDVSELSQPVLIGRHSGMKVSIMDVVVWGGYAYITNLRVGLMVLDIHDPEHPQNIAILPLPYAWPYYGTFKLAIQPPLIYLTNTWNLVVVDVSQPTHPQVLATLPLGGIAQGIDVSDGIAYIGLENGKLVIVDVSKPESPNILETLPIGSGRILDVLVRGEYVYLAFEGFDGLTVMEQFRCDSPNDMRRIANLAQGAGSVALYRDKIILASPYEGLVIVDASQIDSLSIMAVKRIGFSEGRENVVAVIGGYALLGTEWTMQVWDLRSSAFPRLASVPMPGAIYGICAQGNWVFVAVGSSFQVLRLKTDLLVDLDNDNRTTILDAKNLLEQRVGLLPPSESLVDADLNNDGQVTAYDATLLLNTLTDQPIPMLELGTTDLKWESQTLNDSAYEISVMFTGSPVWASEFMISYAANELDVLPLSIKWHLPEGAVAVQSLSRLQNEGRLSLVFASSVPINMDQPFITFMVGNSSIRKSYLAIVGDVVINDGVFHADKNLSLSFKSIPLLTLLPSYPNPSRQGVWIPFILLEDADLIIKIYTVGGQLVRRLELNSQKANSYIDRDSAAHWDGKDMIGQQVSSGVYFYQVSAVNFSAIRKIAILR